jgi:uncharacterized membrane protein YphA (DoxX/SURF4 family)
VGSAEVLCGTFVVLGLLTWLATVALLVVVMLMRGLGL